MITFETPSEPCGSRFEDDLFSSCRPGRRDTGGSLVVDVRRGNSFGFNSERFIGKPTGQIQERVQAVGPEHFGPSGCRSCMPLARSGQNVRSCERSRAELTAELSPWGTNRSSLDDTGYGLLSAEKTIRQRAASCGGRPHRRIVMGRAERQRCAAA